MKNIRSFNLKHNIIILIVILLFLLELIVTFQLYYNSNTTRLIGFYKFFFQIVVLFSIDYTNLNKRLLYLILTLSSVFLLNQLLNPLLEESFSFLILKGSIYYFDRYIFIFLFILMIESRDDKLLIINKSLKYLEYIIIANSIFMVLGFIFDIELFKSYINSTRFGYDGFFNKVNEVSFIYIIYITYLYYITFFFKSRSWFLFFSISITSLLLGTKTILLFFCLLFIFHFFYILKKMKTLKILMGTILFSCLFFFKTIITFLFNLFSFWDGFQDRYGIVTLLLSKRDILLRNAFDYIDVNWSFINYIFGGAFYSDSFALTQMDWSDLVLFFGFLGSIIYILMLVLFFLKKKSITLNLLIVIVLICGLLGGALFMSGMSMILLFLIINVTHNKFSDVQNFF